MANTSRVISFRCSPAKEAAAYAYLQEMEADGHSIREIVNGALTLAAGHQNEIDEIIHRFEAQQDKILQVLERLQSDAVRIVASSEQNNSTDDDELTERFKTGLLNLAKNRRARK